MDNYFDINFLMKETEKKQCHVTIGKRGTGKLSIRTMRDNYEDTLAAHGLVNQTSVLLWRELPTYLCSDKCYSKYWSSLVNQTKES